MSSDHADVAVESYFEVEVRFQEFLRHVPVEPEHNRVHSPVLAAVMLDACSLTETVLKSAMDNARYNQVANIANIRALRGNTQPPHMNIGHLRTVFLGDGYAAKPVWYLPRADRSFPWYVWRQPVGNPSWWTDYNAMKHNRFDEVGLAKLKTTMHAMKALFLVMVQTLDFRDRLAQRGLIRSSGLTTQQLRGIITGWEPIGTQATVIAASNLFGYKFLTTGSPQAAGDVTVFRS